MARIFLYPFKILLFWLLLFGFNRLLFLFLYADQLAATAPSTVLHVFWQALPLDISTACYLAAIPMLLTMILVWKKWEYLNWILVGYHILFLLVIGLILTAESVVYGDWQTKLHYKIFTHLQHPNEVVQSSGMAHRIRFLLLLALLLVFGGVVYKHMGRLNLKRTAANWLQKSMLFGGYLLVCAALLIIGTRGGIGPYPISPSAGYYCQQQLLNEAAINPAWHLGHSLLENKASLDGHAFANIKVPGAQVLVHDLHNYPEDTLTHFLQHPQPNIVLIILESWSADLIEPLGGLPQVTPEFNQLVQEGLLFENFYANGWTSDMGITAILSGFPALPNARVMSQHNKFQQLPCLNKDFAEMGYRSSFYFGGDLRFGNIKGFLMHHAFQKVIDKKDFPAHLASNQLGYHDHVVYDRQLKELQDSTGPFFSVVFTQSTHSPYTVPMQKPELLHQKHGPYVNAVHFADSCLGAYFRKARTMPWHENTLYVLVADHSHISPKDHPYNSPERYKIPLLMYGEVLAPQYRGQKIDQIGTQLDIAHTLLTQLHVPATQYAYSKDLLNPAAPNFGMYVFHDSYGWIEPGGYYFYDDRSGKVNLKRFRDPQHEAHAIQQGHAYLQVVLEDYQGR